MSRKTEIQVGATVLIALAILIWGLAWLKDYSLQRSRRIWHVEFPESGGLAASDEVQVNGLRKGEVRSMALKGDRVRIDLSLDNSITLTHDSRISIRDFGLMGEKVIAVELRATGEPYRPDDIIPGVYEKGLSEVMGNVGTTVDAIARLAGKLETIADAVDQDGGVAKTIRNFDRTTEELHRTVVENRVALHETLTNLAAAAKTAKSLTTDREPQLRKTLDDFSSAANKMEQLSTRLDSLRQVLQNVSSKVDRGEGTIGKLVQDEKLYADLNDSVHSLKELIEDIKAHPKKYFKFSVF